MGGHYTCKALWAKRRIALLLSRVYKLEKVLIGTLPFWFALIFISESEISGNLEFLVLTFIFGCSARTDKT